ncbi:PTS sugar transporter subunit IIA [Lacrimispora sp.]|uniref:PTS sugar transporter subunit IIA n=1 Tax=Lacrimispora sp. TaxID=2719234 RepID=UPI0028A8B611|nr:PTS sugar transporter subunit IIA [Lacrimispora sp.]
MDLKDVINQNAVAVNVRAKNKEEVFDYVCDLLFKDGSITSTEEFKQDLYLRESQGKTGIGEGIAIPHGKSSAVRRNCVSILKVEKPIQWETLDNEPVQVFIIFAVNQKDKNEYFLRLMASVAKKLAQEGVCGKLRNSCSKEEILEAFC